MMLELAGMVLVPVAGWVTKKQLEVNAQTAENQKDIESIKDSVQYIRGRVDGIFDHLIAEKGSRDR